MKCSNCKQEGHNKRSCTSSAATAIAAEPVPEPLKGNEKRKASCQKVGGEKKRGGHRVEVLFQRQFGRVGCSEVTYKAEADNEMCLENAATKKLMKKLVAIFGPDVGTFRNVSNKSGKNIQFTLGKIPELPAAEPGAMADLGGLGTLAAAATLSSAPFWEKYLKKSESAKPADWLVYYGGAGADAAPAWLFFKMDDVIEFITSKCQWRCLDSGRIKGDFVVDEKEGVQQVQQFLTYEYRRTHKSQFLGANGNKGDKFIGLLRDSLKHLEWHAAAAEEGK